MGDFMIQIREELKNYEIILHNDLEEFRKKLNTTRTDLFSYVQRQIKYLNNVLEEYKQEFDYLDQENEKTCDDNLQQFHRLCLSINQNDKNQVVVKKLLQNFQSAFTMRPNMLKYIPEYYFKDIHIDDFIKKQIPNESLLILPKNYYNSYSTIMNGYLSTDKNESDHHDDSLSNDQSEYLRNSYIIFLNRLNNTNKCMIAIHDSDTLDRLRSFDLIDAILPLSMVSSYQSRSTTTTSNNQLEPLLFVNDVKSHVIHCCTYEQYLISIQINAFGICPLDDGNLILVTSRDIRGLKVQNYLQRNNV
ncbi:unnamed protein product [Rotaria sordida]|uniref:Uncharacterized protein n=1 Tax=Rotaria sordida TaxID=392033 RepID=A0A818HH93_9BILA|nr:unnamed protein product [Rotaria sordida]